MDFEKSVYVVCIAKILVKKDKLNEALQVFSDLKSLSPKEPGCIRYELHQDLQNPLMFTFIDRFKDQAAFDYHCNQEYTNKYFDSVLPNLIDSMEITTHSEINFI